MTPRLFLLASALAGASGVLIGAYSAHAGSRLLSARAAEVLDIAVTYQLVHALALAVTAALAGNAAGRFLKIAGAAFTTGIVLFCGSLYVLTFGGPGWLGPVTPIGGSAFVVGWLALGVGAWKST